MAVLIAIFVVLVELTFPSCSVPSTDYSCAPFFFEKIKYEGRVYKSIVRFRCDRSPPFNGTCDPTFTERVYYRTVSGYSCIVEYLARPTPLLEEPPCSDREGYDDYFKQLGMTATPAGWVLQDAKAGVLLQVRPNIPHRLALVPCWDYFQNRNYRYIGGQGGHAWEGVNATHHVWYSLIAHDYRYSACMLSADSRRFDKEKPLPEETPGEPPGNVAEGGCSSGSSPSGGGSCSPNAMVG